MLSKNILENRHFRRKMRENRLKLLPYVIFIPVRERKQRLDPELDSFSSNRPQRITSFKKSRLDTHIHISV
jgi:hypothetical protein